MPHSPQPSTPKSALRVPRLTQHKATGQARVRLAGKDYYLGPFGSDEAQERYKRLIAEWLTGQLPPRPADATPSSTSVSVNLLTHRSAQPMNAKWLWTAERCTLLTRVRKWFGTTSCFLALCQYAQIVSRASSLVVIVASRRRASYSNLPMSDVTQILKQIEAGDRLRAAQIEAAESRRDYALKAADLP